jgi:uncharacterized membrane protein
MIGFFIGTVCLVGLVKVLRRQRYGRFAGPWGYGHAWGGEFASPWDHGGPSPWGGPPLDAYAPDPGPFGGRPFRRRGFGRGRVLDMVARRLGLRPDQEKTVRDALGDLEDTMRGLRKTGRKAREQLASAFRGESLDELSLGEAHATFDEATDAAKKALVDALAKVHGVLDPEQRRLLAELLDRGPFAGFAGPYRGAAY